MPGHSVPGIDRIGAQEIRKVKRAARLGTGARQPLAAKGLAADDRADLVAVDVDIAGMDRLGDLLHAGSMRVCRPKVRP